MPVEGVVVRASPIHGLGVFAARDFRQGELVLLGDESRVVTPERPLRPESGEFEHHCDYLAGGKTILLGFPERHINHCCEPSAYVAYVDAVRGTYALRELRAGEEVTHDYCINGYGDVVWECTCGHPRCRKTIHSDFFHLPLELQIQYRRLLTDWYVQEYREKTEALDRVVAGFQGRVPRPRSG